LLSPLIPHPLPRDYPYRNSTGKIPSEILQAPIHGAGGRGRKGAASLQCTGKWKIKSIMARGKVKAGRAACYVICSFPCKKASQMTVRPFLREEFL